MHNLDSKGDLNLVVILSFLLCKILVQTTFFFNPIMNHLLEDHKAC